MTKEYRDMRGCLDESGGVESQIEYLLLVKYMYTALRVIAHRATVTLQQAYGMVQSS
jgi:hypothetical protein